MPFDAVTTLTLAERLQLHGITPAVNAAEIAICDGMLVLLRKRGGWRRHSYGGPTEGFCLVGAANWAARKEVVSLGYRLPPPAETRVKKAMTQAIHFRGGSEITIWNDEPNRRKREVIALVEEVRESFVAEALASAAVVVSG